MEEPRFFKMLWRFNSIVIAFAGLAAIGLICFVSYMVFKEATRERTTHDIVNIEKASGVRESWRLGQLVEIQGSQKVMVPLYSDQTFDQDYFSKSTNSTRNYLFVDKNTTDSQWLFSNTDYLIENHFQLRRGGQSSKEPVLAILYYLVKLDTNKDNRLSAQDTTTIALTNPEGGQYMEVLSGVDSVVGFSLLNERELLFMYEKNQAFFTTKFNIVTGEIVGNTEVSNVGL